jgi:Mg-chelatase subunit ChlD
MAQLIARRLSIRARERDRRVVPGSGARTTMPYRDGSDDIDLDRTLEVLTGRPAPEDRDIMVRERVRGRRALALIVDVSGSMRGEKARIAAATVGALSGELVDDELVVVAFWQDAALVKPLTHAATAGQLLDRLLSIPSKGLTNVHFGLSVGLTELDRARCRHRSALLVSDAVHNAGPDPRTLAARFPRLDLLLETDGEHDPQLGADLARLGRGQLLQVRHHLQVAGALNRILHG